MSIPCRYNSQERDISRFRGSRRKRVSARSWRGRNEAKIRVKPVLREVADRNSAARGREGQRLLSRQRGTEKERERERKGEINRELTSGGAAAKDEGGGR